MNRATFINRYITTDDYQTYFATDVKMRLKAQAEYEAQVEAGVKQIKDRNFVVRGRRVYDDSHSWSMDARVNH